MFVQRIIVLKINTIYYNILIDIELIIILTPFLKL